MNLRTLPEEQKKQIVIDSNSLENSLSEIAQKHDISIQQLYGLRYKYRDLSCTRNKKTPQKQTPEPQTGFAQLTVSAQKPLAQKEHPKKSPLDPNSRTEIIYQGMVIKLEPAASPDTIVQIAQQLGVSV